MSQPMPTWRRLASQRVEAYPQSLKALAPSATQPHYPERPWGTASVALGYASQPGGILGGIFDDTTEKAVRNSP